MPPIRSIGTGVSAPHPSFRTRRLALDVERASAFKSRNRLVQLRRFDDTLRSLRTALGSLNRHTERLAAAGAGGARTQRALAVSHTALDFGPGPTTTTLTSTDEVNAIATSYTPFGPTVTGFATTLPTIGGVYDGDQGDDTLTFELRHDRVVGAPGRLRVRVFDGSGKRIETLRFDRLAPDTPLTLRNGLTLALGSGASARGSTFQVSVSDTVGSSVDPTKPFDGARNDQPGFEPGLGVAAGSFTVNGVSIAVGASDSIEAVLDRITTSAAGVDADFDAATERITLTQRSTGSTGRVVLGGDTSGFLTATKLAGASELLGLDGFDPLVDPIGSLPSLAGVTAGSLAVNGVSITVDPASDSLVDLTDRINASGAGVRAAFDLTQELFSISSLGTSQRVSVSDGNSGFFSAVNIAPGRYDPVAPKVRPLSAQHRRQIGEALEEVTRHLDSLLTSQGAGETERELESARRSFADVVVSRFEALASGSSLTRLQRRVGLVLNRSDARGRLEIDARRLKRALARDPSDLHRLLFGDASDPGLSAALSDRVAAAQDSLATALGRGHTSGRLLDLIT